MKCNNTFDSHLVNHLNFSTKVTYSSEAKCLARLLILTVMSHFHFVENRNQLEGGREVKKKNWVPTGKKFKEEKNYVTHQIVSMVVSFPTEFQPTLFTNLFFIFLLSFVLVLCKSFGRIKKRIMGEDTEIYIM